MSEITTPENLRRVGENCSQYQQEERDLTATMNISEDEGVSCGTCRHWSGSRCMIDAFDNVAVNLGILPEED